MCQAHSVSLPDSLIKIQLSPKTMAEVEAERKMGTRFSSKLFLWRLPSSSWRVWSRAVVPLTKVSIVLLMPQNCEVVNDILFISPGTVSKEYVLYH